MFVIGNGINYQKLGFIERNKQKNVERWTICGFYIKVYVDINIVKHAEGFFSG